MSRGGLDDVKESLVVSVSDDQKGEDWRLWLAFRYGGGKAWGQVQIGDVTSHDSGHDESLTRS